MRVPAPQGRRLDPRYRIEALAESDATDEDVIAMWTGEGALEPGAARERVRDVVLVALEEEAGVIGVSTAWLQENPTLGMGLWNYRTFVARDHREGDIAFLLLHATRDHLSERFAGGADTRAQGIVFEVQNEILKRARNEAVWPTSGFAFIGEDERGAHHRVHYFPGAIVPLPPGVGSGA
jgi:hypothetical protein